MVTPNTNRNRKEIKKFLCECRLRFFVLSRHFLWSRMGVRGATIVWHGGEESVNVSVHACGNFKVHLILTSSRALLCFSAIFLLPRSNFFNSTSKKSAKIQSIFFSSLMKYVTATKHAWRGEFSSLSFPASRLLIGQHSITTPECQSPINTRMKQGKESSLGVITFEVEFPLA